MTKKERGEREGQIAPARLVEARRQLEEWARRTVWQGSFDRPYRAVEVQLRALFLVWELASADGLDGQDLARVERELGEVRAMLDVMAGLPKHLRDFEFRVAVQHGRWAADVVDALLEKARRR